jgi:hypothetical protein
LDLYATVQYALIRVIENNNMRAELTRLSQKPH